MNLRHLETFVAIAETGSFQAAAERVCLTQSSVSMQMKALEAELDVIVFDRSSRPPTLNPTGRRLLEPAREVLLSMEAFRRTAAGPGHMRDPLRVGVILTVASSFLPGALLAFREAHPTMQVRVERGVSKALQERVMEGALDAAVISEPSLLPQELVSLTLLHDRLLIAVHRDAPDLPAAELLEALPFIRFKRDTTVGRITESGLQSLGVHPNAAMELDSMPAILEMVYHRLGVAVIPESCISKHIASSVLTVPFGEPVMERRLGLVVTRRRRDEPFVQTLFKALRDAAREQIAGTVTASHRTNSPSRGHHALKRRPVRHPQTPHR